MQAIYSRSMYAREICIAYAYVLYITIAVIWTVI